MGTKRSQSVARTPRVDAQRNRDRVLELAKEACTRLGADASLDDVAKQAGVGMGILYRHFPTRDELLKTVTEVSRKAGLSGAEVCGDDAPWKRCGPRCFLPQISEAIRGLVKPAIKSGDIRKDLSFLQNLVTIVTEAEPVPRSARVQLERCAGT